MATSMNYPTFNYGRYEKSCPYRPTECNDTRCPDGFRNREEYNRPYNREMTRWQHPMGWYPGNFGSRDFFRYSYDTCPWMHDRYENRGGFDNFYRHAYEVCPWMHNRENTPWGRQNFETMPWHHYQLDSCPWFNNDSSRNWMDRFNRNNNWMDRFNPNQWYNRFFGNDWFKHFEKDLGQFRNFFDKWWNNNNYSTSLTQTPSRPASNLEYYTFMNPVKVDGYGNRWLYICFDLRSFKPEEVRCTLYTQQKYIEVEANHHVKDSKEHDVKRTYCRKYYFPADLYCGDVSKLELKSYMTNEGYLYCEARLPQLKPEEAKEARPHMPVNSCPVKVEVKQI